MEKTVSALFTLDELWLLQATVRHEVAQSDLWKFPPASLSLNDAIASAILFCHEQGVMEAAVMLGRHDCLVIDYNVPAGAKDANGKPLGKTVLLKSFRARQELEETLAFSAEAGQEMDLVTIRERLAERARRRRRSRNA